MNTYNFTGEQLAHSIRSIYHCYPTYLLTSKIYDFQTWLKSLPADSTNFCKYDFSAFTDKAIDDDGTKILCGLCLQDNLRYNKLNKMTYGRSVVEKENNNEYLFTRHPLDMINKIRIKTNHLNLSVQLWQKTMDKKIVDAIYNKDNGYYFFPDFENNYLPNCTYPFYLKILLNSGDKLDEYDYKQIEVSARVYALDTNERRELHRLEPMLIPLDSIKQFLFINNIQFSYDLKLIPYDLLGYGIANHCNYDYDFEENAEKYLTITI